MIARWVGEAITWIFQKEGFPREVKRIDYTIVVDSEEIPNNAHAATARVFTRVVTVEEWEELFADFDGNIKLEQDRFAAYIRKQLQLRGITKPAILLPRQCSWMTVAHEAIHLLYPEIDDEAKIEYKAAMLWKEFVWEREGRQVTIEEYEEDRKLSVEE